MREIGKTKGANVLVALGCCAIAVIAFHLNGARGEDPGPDPRSKAPIRIETIERLLPSTEEANETAGCALTPRTVVLTCRLDQVELAPGFHKN